MVSFAAVGISFGAAEIELAVHKQRNVKLICEFDGRYAFQHQFMYPLPRLAQLSILRHSGHVNVSIADGLERTPVSCG
jgi:hypothetical protein